MTNRFTGEFDKQYSGVHDNGEQLTNFEVVDLLNNLSEENEKLKSKNRGLQSELQIFKEDVTHSNLQINKLGDENEQLKQQLKELQEFKDNYDKNMELIHNSEYVQDFLNGNL